MAALKSDPSRCDAKPAAAADDDNDNDNDSAHSHPSASPSPSASPPPSPSPLARVIREWKELVWALEMGLLRSLEHDAALVDRRAWRREHIRHEARRLAIAELSTRYTRKHIARSLYAAEARGRRAEEHLHAARDAPPPPHDDDLRSIHNGYFRLYSTELFDLLGQPTDLRFGTLRFHRHTPHAADTPWVSVELALGASSFFVADSMETMPYHAFKVPPTPSLQNRGILSRKPDDNGAFPAFDSWLLFTFLGHGCLKLEMPIEMCADVYGGPLRGRENEDVHFWGLFVDDDFS